VTFEQAKAHALERGTGNRIKRAAWNFALYVVAYGALLHARDDGGVEPWVHTSEDRAATDWVVLR
jgi:hypothetical protein